ncbi:SRPBCC domain-containing protein [Alkalinema pantanalense CENA528]|uniref:SRPBCC domain-containing protein n=1 Tax=Alkalinema pantanalense TaxID=1620705 RepID=UPI003D7021F7
MPTLYHETLISAPRQAVWEALVYKDRWRFWNTFLYDCSPKLSFQAGQSIVLALRRVPGDDPVEFKATVTQLQPTFNLHWKASIPGFRSDVALELQDVGPAVTKYLYQERFSGWVSRFALSFIKEDQLRGIRRMSGELKDYVERF